MLSHKGLPARISLLFLILGTIFFVSLLIMQRAENQKHLELLQAKSAAYLEDTQTLFSNILELKSVTLNALSDSFAFWDEVVNFVANPDPEWAANNLDSGFGTFEAQMMWVYDTSGNLVYYSDVSDAYDFKAQGPSMETVASWAKSLSRPHVYFMSDQGMVQLIGFPVQSTDDPTRKSPAKGFLISGRLWDTAFIKSLALMTKTEIEIQPGEKAAEQAYDFTVRLPSIDGTTAATLYVKSTSNALATQPSSFNRHMLTILVFCIGLFLALHIALHRWVMRPFFALAEVMTQKVERTLAIAAELSSRGEQLNQGATAQAEAITTTNREIENVFTLSTRTMHDATKVNGAIVSLNEHSSQGSEAMSELTQAVERIRSASSEAMEIIETIDEIAFQTNLLALNAAVEAARAGEAGKGFAVVADEVRSLAQRSAQAAQVTSQKLLKAKDETDSGADASSAAARVFTQVKDGTQTTSDLMGSIAGASKSQSNSLDQVRDTLHKLNQFTSQTGNLAHLSQSTAQELISEARDIQQSVTELREILQGAGSNSMRIE